MVIMNLYISIGSEAVNFLLCRHNNCFPCRCSLALIEHVHTRWQVQKSLPIWGLLELQYFWKYLKLFPRQIDLEALKNIQNSPQYTQLQEVIFLSALQ